MVRVRNIEVEEAKAIEDITVLIRKVLLSIYLPYFLLENATDHSEVMRHH